MIAHHAQALHTSELQTVSGASFCGLIDSVLMAALHISTLTMLWLQEVLIEVVIKGTYLQPVLTQHYHIDAILQAAISPPALPVIPDP